MKVCKTCGMSKDGCPSHKADYAGPGKHDYSEVEVPTNKSLSDEESEGEILIAFGGEIKALEEKDGKGGFEGYLVRYSDSENPDLVGDFFTKSTELFVEEGSIIPVLYDHGLNATLKRRKIGRAKTAYKDAGLFIQGELDLRDDFEKAVYEELVKKGKAGLSSGAASHMVTRKRSDKKGITEILEWGVAEASITPAHTELENTVEATTTTLKSYIETRHDPFDAEHKCACNSKEEPDDNNEAEDEPVTTRSMKSAFESKLSEITPDFGQLLKALGDVCKDIANAAATTNISGGDVNVEQKVTEAVTEHAARSIPIIVKGILDYLDGDNYNKQPFNLKFYADQVEGINSVLSIKSSLVTDLKLDEHSAKVVSAVEEFATISASLSDVVKAWEKRCKDKVEFRAGDSTKSGRVISAATLEKLDKAHSTMGSALEAMKASHGHIGELMQLANPKKAEEKSFLPEIELALARHRNEMALAGVST